MGEAVTDQPTFMPEPVDPEAEGADAIAPAWDPEDWPEMASATPRVDEPVTEQSTRDAEPPVGPDSTENWARDAAPAASAPPADASAPDAAEAYVPFADRVPEPPLPVAAGSEYFASSGPTSHDNHLGNYAMFFGVVAFVSTAVLYLWGAGLWWLDVVLGGLGAYYGVRGFNAASRGRATNRSSAVVGGLMGLAGAIAAAAYLVVVALVLTSGLR